MINEFYSEKKQKLLRISLCTERWVRGEGPLYFKPRTWVLRSCAVPTTSLPWEGTISPQEGGQGPLTHQPLLICLLAWLKTGPGGLWPMPLWGKVKGQRHIPSSSLFSIILHSEPLSPSLWERASSVFSRTLKGDDPTQPWSLCFLSSPPHSAFPWPKGRTGGSNSQRPLTEGTRAVSTNLCIAHSHVQGTQGL